MHFSSVKQAMELDGEEMREGIHTVLFMDWLHENVFLLTSAKNIQSPVLDVGFKHTCTNRRAHTFTSVFKNICINTYYST